MPTCDGIIYRHKYLFLTQNFLKEMYTILNSDWIIIIQISAMFDCDDTEGDDYDDDELDGDFASTVADCEDDDDDDGGSR